MHISWKHRSLLHVLSFLNTIQIRLKKKQSLRKHTPGPPSTTVGGAGSSQPATTAVSTQSAHPTDLDSAVKGDTISSPLIQLQKIQLQKHSSKHKDNDRPLKRTSSETLPPVKRKYRRRKLSSSNESSTSEAPSNTSEIRARDSNQPASPLGLLSSDSSNSKKEETNQPISLDNLDLLASVTQKMDTQPSLGRGSLPVSPNSASSEGTQMVISAPAEQEQDTDGPQKRKSSTAHAAVHGPPAARYMCTLYMYMYVYIYIQLYAHVLEHTVYKYSHIIIPHTSYSPSFCFLVLHLLCLLRVFRSCWKSSGNRLHSSFLTRQDAETTVCT